MGTKACNVVGKKFSELKMGIESIGAIGASPGVGAMGAKGGVKSSSGGNEAVSSPKAAPSSPSGNGGVADMCKNMSTSNFVTLSQQVNGASKGGAPDAEQMVQAILALQLLEKVVEAVGQVLETIFNPDK